MGRLFGNHKCVIGSNSITPVSVDSVSTTIEIRGTVRERVPHISFSVTELITLWRESRRDQKGKDEGGRKRRGKEPEIRSLAIWFKVLPC